MWYIDSKKEKGLRPQNIEFSGNAKEDTFQQIYQAYQDTCDLAGIVDFSELLLRAYELWVNKPYILYHYRERFLNILVDEFQDTNHIQYSWIRMLVDNNIMSVGDDDQSIYGWRGAQVENMQCFLRDFPDVKTISLEQNYRSTSNILRTANTLISNNSSRLAKNLWTKGTIGEPISLYCASNELDEARFIINSIRSNRETGLTLGEYAILYRSNAQSRVLEEELLQMGIPYHIYGGMRFFERQEIKDALAYLRLIIINRNDDSAYERIVNRPTRGLGERTLSLVRKTAQDRQLTLWQASWTILTEGMLSGSTASALQRFLELLNTLEEKTAQLPLHLQTDWVIKYSGLWKMYEQIQGEKGQTRIENLAELITATRQFSYRNRDQELSSLQAFLSYAILEAGESQTETCQDAVKLMTLHSSKGLEFSQVFIVGMEEGILPSRMSLDKGERLEEERRLAYVGITRAMKKLTITHAKTRRLYGKDMRHQPSRFIYEMPTACIKKIHLCPYTMPVKTLYSDTLPGSHNENFEFGQRVRHPQFGEGKIINFEKRSGEHSRLQIDFQDQGIRWLIATHSLLERV